MKLLARTKSQSFRTVRGGSLIILVGALVLLGLSTVPSSSLAQEGGVIAENLKPSDRNNFGLGEQTNSALPSSISPLKQQAQLMQPLEPSQEQLHQQQQPMPTMSMFPTEFQPLAQPSSPPSSFTQVSESPSSLNPPSPRGHIEPTPASNNGDLLSPVPSSSATSTTNGGSGIVNFIFSPIHSVIRHARKLFGESYANVNEGVDMVRLKTYKIFMQLYNKTYLPEEIPRRMALFFERRKLIENSVQNFREGKSLFYLRENDFIDWNQEELKKLTGVSKPSDSELSPEELAPTVHANVSSGVFGAKSNVAADEETRNNEHNEQSMSVRAESIPASKDWRDSGCVSKPINQRKCGACYAIASIIVLETMRCLNKVSSPILSPQQIVDCANSRAGYQNYGCDGGWPTNVFKYLQNVQVASRETCYPFTHREGACKLRQVKASSGCTVSSSPTDTSLQYKVLHNERDILYHVANTGPVGTVMKASDAFLMYGNGIFDDWRCSNKRDDVDHAVTIIGYGRENGVDFWIIKNSWGTTTWGQGGYGKYRRGKNACSIGHWGWVVTS